MDKWEGSQLNRAKEILAYELTALVHGEEEAKKAQEGARALFSSGSAEHMPTAELAAEDFMDGAIDIVSLLHRSGLAASRSEGRRAVEQGGVAVDGEKITDPKAVIGSQERKEEFPESDSKIRAAYEKRHERLYTDRDSVCENCA